MPVDRNELIRIARTWIGVPFLHRGRSREGIDCGGLLIAVGREIGLKIDEPNTYSMSPDPGVIETSLKRYCTQIEIDSAQAGDILWLSFAGEPRHVGFATDTGLLHAWAGPGKVVEHTVDSVWKKRVRAAYRLHEVESA